MSTVIKNGTIVTADLTYKSDVKIDNGVITEIGPDLSGDETLDATGCYVMPGGIDPHVHLEMPFMGTYSTDDFESGTRAALAGGTTMVVDFCLPNPGQSLLEAIQRWDNKSTRANCDYSFHMAITWWDEQVFNEMETVVREKGINTFKHFMAYKGALMVQDDEMYASFQRCAELGAMPLVHAENGDVVADLSARLLAEGNNGPEAHAYSRPPQVEGEATNRAIMIADMAGVPLYVVHTSCEQSHEAIRRARQNGMRVYGEPLIQHLTLDESEYFDKDWDHAARRVMRSEEHTSELQSLRSIVAVTSTNIAKILNCYPKKGAILVGSDADIVVWDPEKEKTISADNQQSAIDYNVFEGKTVKGLPRFTLSRGKVCVNDGKMTNEEGWGKFVKREPYGAVNTALSTWKALTSPRKIERTGIPATGV